MQIKRYLKEIEEHGADSEIALYTPIATFILNGILGYPSNRYSINKAGIHGTPDIRLYSDQDNLEWVIVEVKLNDEEIRNEEKRKKIWNEQIVKKTYLKAETVYVLLCSPRTFYVCDLEGQIIEGLHIEKDNLIDFSLKESCIISDDNFRKSLASISFEESSRGKQYEQFRNGKIKGGYIQITEKTITELYATFNYAIKVLKSYCQKIFDTLKIEYNEANKKIIELQEKLETIGSADDRAKENILSKIRYQKKKHRLCLQLFESDFPQFKHDQTYAGTEKEIQFEDIFFTNTAHVALSRLFFVRICEDIGLTTRKISNEGPGIWRRFVRHIKDRYQDLMNIAFQDISYVYTKLFEETVFDWFGKGNSELNEILEKILFRLNAYSFNNANRDLLGKIYECFRPPSERKRLGEYYTPEEVVDFILDRTGISRDKELMTKTVLDPACGSFTFGVRALMHLIEMGKNLTNKNKIELVRRCLVGFDINPFSTFLSHLSLLFAILDIYFEEKSNDEKFKLEGFNVHNVNSLTYYLGYQVEMLGEEKEDILFERNSFDYVIGNPPFVRNERLPIEDRHILDKIFQDIKSGNTDLSTYFLYTVINDFLKDGGTLGMVSPLGISNTKMSLKFREYAKNYHIFALVSLEWMAKEIFPDADIIPMLIFIKKEKSELKSKIKIITGLSKKYELKKMVDDSEFSKQHVSEIDYDKWLNLSPTGDWPVEIKSEDVGVLEKLRKNATLDKIVQVNFAIKPGAHSRCTKPYDIENIDDNLMPFLMGQNVCTYGISEPEELFVVSKINEVSDKSIWGDLSFYRKNQGKHDDTGLGRTDYESSGLAFNNIPTDIMCCLIPKISATLNAAVINPLNMCANDSVLVVVPYQYNARVISAIINSKISRYYSFLLMRSAVLLRRRCNWFPRVIKNLPLPNLSKKQASKINQLVYEAEEVSLNTYLDEITLFTNEIKNKKLIKMGFLGIKIEKLEGDIDKEDVDNALIVGNKLIIDKNEISSNEPDLLYLLKVGLISSDFYKIDRGMIENFEIPEDKSIRKELTQKLINIEKNLDEAKSKMETITNDLDEIVAAALNLTFKDFTIIKNRCSEFPLSVTVNRPRYMWSPDRKRQPRRIYDIGERFKRIYREK